MSASLQDIQAAGGRSASPVVHSPAPLSMQLFEATGTKVSCKLDCRRFGARVVLRGADLGEARMRADEIAAEQSRTSINGFDDPAVVAAQSTLGLEIVRQVPEVAAVLVPACGAGLIAAVALALKTLKPEVRIIGVEPECAASFTEACRAGRPVRVDLRPTLADGHAVAQVWAHPFQIARETVDQVLRVGEHGIALGILRLMELEKTVVEGFALSPA